MELRKIRAEASRVRLMSDKTNEVGVTLIPMGSWWGGGVEVAFAGHGRAVCKCTFSEVRVQIVEQNPSVSIFPGPSDVRADSEALVYCVLSISNGGTRRAHLPIFLPVSHLACHE